MVDGPGLAKKQATEAKAQGIDGNKRQKGAAQDRRLAFNDATTVGFSRPSVSRYAHATRNS